MAADDIFPFNMNSAEGGRSFCASVVEDVLQQRKSGFNDILALRRAEESVSRRHQAAAWLRKMAGLIGSRDLPNDPSEEEFLLGLRNGMILCNVINKVHHGSVPKVVENPIDSVHLPDGAALSAYQYFENVRNFLVAIEEMGLPSFEASDLEKGGSCIKVVNCILALKSYNEWKQAGANGSWKFGNSMKHPTPGKCILRVGKNSDPFMNAYRNISQIDSNVMSEQKIGEYSNGFPVNISMEATKMGSSNHSLGTLVRAALSDRRPEEVPTLVESMLMKVMEEFECRLANQNKQITDTIKNLSISDDRKSLPSVKLSDSLSSTCGETMNMKEL